MVKDVKVASDSIAKPLLIADTMYVKTINGILYSINIETGKRIGPIIMVHLKLY